MLGNISVVECSTIDFNREKKRKTTYNKITTGSKRSAFVLDHCMGSARTCQSWGWSGVDISKALGAEVGPRK